MDDDFEIVKLLLAMVLGVASVLCQVNNNNKHTTIITTTASSTSIQSMLAHKRRRASLHECSFLMPSNCCFHQASKHAHVLVAANKGAEGEIFRFRHFYRGAPKLAMSRRFGCPMPQRTLQGLLSDNNSISALIECH